MDRVIRLHTTVAEPVCQDHDSLSVSQARNRRVLEDRQPSVLSCAFIDASWTACRSSSQSRDSP